MPGMAARADAPSFNTAGHGSTDYPPLSLAEVILGYPVTVDADTNPFISRPADLNERTWYHMPLDQIGDSDAGSWRQKGEPCWMPFPDLPIKACWEIIWAFHESNGQESDWMMLQYNITTANGAFSSFRIGKDPRNDNARVGGPAPGYFDNDGHHANHYPFPRAAGNPFESYIFYRGEYIELLDLITSLLPPASSE